MRIEALQMFTRVAELASFTGAADSLGLPKASVSTAVQQLEAKLGTQLLHRTTRKVQLTHDGQRFYERCKVMLADMDELTGMFRQAPHALSGSLRVDMNGQVAKVVVQRLPEFLQRHPQLRLELSCSDRRVDVVAEGFDCVLRVGTLSDSSLVARPLGQFPVINVASVDYIARYGAPQTLDDLARHQLVHYVTQLGQKPEGFEYMHEGVCRYVPMAGVMTVNSVDAYQEACLAGLGMIQAPPTGLAPLIEQGRLVQILPQYQAESMPVSLLYAQRRHLSARVQAFMQWLSEVLAPRLEPLATRRT